jgi:hypothetical protein
MIHKVHTPNTFHALPSNVDLELAALLEPEDANYSYNVDLELLAALLEPEDATYPWNPADEESEAYFSQLEQQCKFADFLAAEELTTRSDNFYHHLDLLWSGISHPQTHQLQQTVNYLQQSLHQVFTSLIPAGWLDTIANQATELFKSEQSAGEKLVNCVQSLLPDWQSEDLLVLSRNYALSMRSVADESLPPIIDSLKEREWSNLSEIEQAKISLAIADYAFQLLQEIDPEL